MAPKDTMPGLGEETPMTREPSLMAVAIAVARTSEQVKYIAERMSEAEDRERERDERMERFVTAVVRGAVDSAMREHFAPLDERVSKMETEQLEQKVVVKTSIKWASAAGAVIAFAWSIGSKFLGL